MTYTRKAALGFTIVAIGAFLSAAFTYAFRLLLARNLSVAEYGLIFSTIALFGIVQIFATLGMGSTLSKLIAEYNVTNKQRIKEVVAWSAILLFSSSILISLLAFVSADWIAANYFGNPEAAWYVQVYSIFFLLTPILVVVRGVLKGNQRMDLEASLHALFGLILFSSTAFFLWLGYQGRSAMYAYILIPILLGIVYGPVVFKLIQYKGRTSLQKETVYTLFFFGLPFIFTGFAATLLTYVDTVLLTKMTTLYDVGLYQTALPTASTLLIFGSVFTTVLLPMISELWARQKKKLITAAITELYQYMTIGFLPLVLAFMLFSDIVLNILFGQQYLPAASTLSILALATSFLIFNAVNAAILSGIGHPRENAKALGWGVAVNIIVNIGLIPHYGILGAAIATLVSSILIVVLTTKKLTQHISLKPPWFIWMKIAFAAIIFLLVLILLRESLDLRQMIKIPLALILSTAVYFILIWQLKILAVEDVRKLAHKILRKDI